MLNRRSFVSFLSTLPIFGFAKIEAKESVVRAEKEIPFFSKEYLRDEYLKVFPEGFHLTEENTQKLIDNGFFVKQLFFKLNGKLVTDAGTFYYKDGLYHREDGPAAIYTNEQCWYKNGLYHREDGPARICPDGTQRWYLNGKLHREGGPAIVYTNGTQRWYLNGKLHREGGPAVIEERGHQEWYLNGERHREDGPALIYEDGTQKWYISDKIHREDGPAVIYANGTKFYYRDGVLLK